MGTPNQPARKILLPLAGVMLLGSAMYGTYVMQGGGGAALVTATTNGPNTDVSRARIDSLMGHKVEVTYVWFTDTAESRRVIVGIMSRDEAFKDNVYVPSYMLNGKYINGVTIQPKGLVAIQDLGMP